MLDRRHGKVRLSAGLSLEAFPKQGNCAAAFRRLCARLGRRGQHVVRLQRTRHQEFPDPPGRDALHPVCRPRQPGRRGERDAAGPRPQQYRARPCLLGLQLRLCSVSAGRRLVCRPLRRAAHADRLRPDLVAHDDRDRGGDRARFAVCRAPRARHGRGCDVAGGYPCALEMDLARAARHRGRDHPRRRASRRRHVGADRRLSDYLVLLAFFVRRARHRVGCLGGRVVVVFPRGSAPASAHHQRRTGRIASR